MKKYFLILFLSVLMTVNSSAQSDWALNTRAWSTNYWTTLIYNVGRTLVADIILDDCDDSLTVRRIVPMGSLVLPIGFQKKGFDYPMDIYEPYHRAFGNPFKHIGDYAIGLDVAWTPSVIGLYAGAYFKSQEITFANEPLELDEENIRSYYFQPRAGISLNLGKERRFGIEMGAFYDMVAGCGGSMMKDMKKDMLESGWGLDFAIRRSNKNSSIQSVIQLSVPLHNFLNEDYDGGSFKGMKRKVGYLMFTGRITL